MKYTLALCTYYYGFRDRTDIVESDDHAELVKIAYDPDFREWALANGFNQCAIWEGRRGCWFSIDFIGDMVKRFVNHQNRDKYISQIFCGSRALP